jgi:biopolymer transport protein ExbD
VRRRWQRIAKRDVNTVDVTAFLSLMVILVPFLLVTAVFSQTTILELQQTGGEGTQQPVSEKLQLMVTLRENVIEVDHFGLEQPVQINRSTDGEDLTSLATLANELKALNPQSVEATVLLEPQIPYDLLVQVLDALRISVTQHEDVVEQQTLFPNIALAMVQGTGQSGHCAP